MKSWFHLILPLLLVTAAFAVEDVPLFYEGICEKYPGVVGTSVNVPGGFNLLTSVVFNNATGQAQTSLPLNCAASHRGMSSVQFELTSDLSQGNWYSFQLKFGDDKMKALPSDYKDVRFFVKNNGATVARLHPLLQIYPGYTNKYAPHVTVPVGSDWTEITVSLTDFKNYATGDSIVGFGFGYDGGSGDVSYTGTALNLLLDDIRFTDGTAHDPQDGYAVGGGITPAIWGTNFLVGSLDNAINPTKAAQAGSYRYNYMHAIDPTAYMATSSALGVKSAFVWYQFGLNGQENNIYANMNTASWMSAYVALFEEKIAAIKAGLDANPTQAPVILVLEPDAYGKLMQKEMKDLDATKIPCIMDQANAASGKTYGANLMGLMQYMVERSKAVIGSDKLVVGHLLNHWGVDIPGQVGQGRLEAHIMSGLAQGAFLNSLGSGKGDVVFVEKTDRDAAFKKTSNPTEDWSWIDTNYTKFFTWVKCLSASSSLRVIGWQVSEGSTHQTDLAKFADDAPEYFLAHPADWASAGFIGLLFGGGASNNANYPMDYPTQDGKGGDNGWFVTNMNNYMKAPLALSAVLTPVPATITLFHSVSNLGNLAVSQRNQQIYWNGFGVGEMELRDLTGRMVARTSLAVGHMGIPHSGVWVWRAKTAGNVRSGTLLAR